jgi:cation transport protein ChaC
MANARRHTAHVEHPPRSDGRDIWIFAYGSLMWNPGFPFREARPALLRGYHRAFCLYSHRYRGTPEKPGLVLGLDAGGACRGIAYRVAARQTDKVMDYLWKREMPHYAYELRHLRVRLTGRVVPAYAFVVRRDHRQYAGRLSDARTAVLICQGHGSRGACTTYLENTVRHLDALGIVDRRLRNLLDRVQKLAVRRRRTGSAARLPAG